MAEIASSKARKRCAVYCRVFSDERLDQEFNSIDAQKQAGHTYIVSQRAEGWIPVAKDYDDPGFSGGNTDRLTRSLTDFSKMVDVFEREVTGERIRDKIAAAKKKGMWVGGVPTIGDDVVNRQLVINPGETAVVRRMFEEMLTLTRCCATASTSANCRTGAPGIRACTSRLSSVSCGTRFTRCWHATATSAASAQNCWRLKDEGRQAGSLRANDAAPPGCAAPRPAACGRGTRGPRQHPDQRHGARFPLAAPAQHLPSPAGGVKKEVITPLDAPQAFTKQAEGINSSQVHRLMRLTLLAPDVVERLAARAGRPRVRWAMPANPANTRGTGGKIPTDQVWDFGKWWAV